MPTPPDHPRWPVQPGAPARTPETQPPAALAAFGTGSGRTAGSRGRSRQLVGGKGEAGPDVVGSELRKIGEQLRDGHPASEILQHIAHRDPHAADARLPAPLARLDGDELRIVHAQSLPVQWHAVNERASDLLPRTPTLSS